MVRKGLVIGIIFLVILLGLSGCTDNETPNDDNDGYGDTPYDIPSGTDKDSKPLMNPFR